MLICLIATAIGLTGMLATKNVGIVVTASVVYELACISISRNRLH